MIADPGERKIGDDFLIRADLVEQIAVVDRHDEILEGEHHAFGPSGRARRIENDGKVAALCAVDRPLPRRHCVGIARKLLAAERLHVGK